MTRKEEIYPDPEIFSPSRFLKNGKLNKDIRDPLDFVFGFGRRYASRHFIHTPKVLS
jgi:cytochrome P450